jgi:hypothetical protein
VPETRRRLTDGVGIAPCEEDRTVPTPCGTTIGLTAHNHNLCPPAEAHITRRSGRPAVRDGWMATVSRIGIEARGEPGPTTGRVVRSDGVTLSVLDTGGQGDAIVLLHGMLVAGRQPDLVRSLGMVESGKHGGDKDTVQRVETWLDSWPVPFANSAIAQNVSRDPVGTHLGAPGPTPRWRHEGLLD